jgi:hypothetical protein
MGDPPNLARTLDDPETKDRSVMDGNTGDH